MPEVLNKALSYLDTVSRDTMREINAISKELPKHAVDESVMMKLMLEMAPGSGDVIAAKDSAHYASEAYKNIREGDIGAAATNLTWSLVAGAGALPALP